jgi:hypothetical protein
VEVPLSSSMHQVSALIEGLGVWCVLLVRQYLRLSAVGFTQQNHVWPASKIPLRLVR